MDLILENAHGLLKMIRDFRADVLTAFFEGTPEKMLDYDFNYTPIYCSKFSRISNVVNVSQIFGIEVIDLNRKQLDKVLWLLQNEVEDFESFNSSLTFIENVFKDASYELRHKINLLHFKEMERLNEALNCYINGLNYSTIILSVSAIEARLYLLMKSKCPLEKLDKLDKLTLGQLVGEYTNNAEQYGMVIPKKHLSLLNYCNNYRVFSVHPKEEKITGANATAILCMTSSFLFDEQTKPSLKLL